MTEAPIRWEEVTVGDFGEVVGGGTPSRANPSYWNGLVPWTTPAEITALAEKHIRDTREKLTPEGLAASAAQLLPVGSLVVTTRATLGKVAIASVALTTNQGFKNIIPNDRTDSLFAYYRVEALRSEMERLASGTTFLEISKADFCRIRTRRPPFTEQVRIAAVLDTADESIAATETMMTKLMRLRTGLLQDLLTRGLDENGEVRDPVTHPEQFTDSEIGIVPKDWHVRPLSYFISSAEYGISTSLSSEGTLPVLRMNNLAGGEASLADLKYATLEVPEALLLQDGDVLFNRTNSFEHVGRTGIWRGQIQRATFASYLVRLNPVPTRLTSEFLNLVLNSREVQRRMRRFATPAVQQVNISPSSLQRMHIAVPERIEEQEQIAARALSMRDSVVSHTRELHKLRSLRAGLMSDLLQGRVRVPEDLKSEALA